MPPVNSPLLAATHSTSPSAIAHHSHLSPPPPARTPSPSTFLSETAPTLSSPVLDLASTLTIQAEDDVDHDNVDFLRRPVEEELSADSLTREIRSERRRMNRIEDEPRDRSWAQVQGRSRERTMADLRSLSEQEARERRLHTRRMAELRTAMDRRWSQPSTRPAPSNSAPPYTGADNASNSLYDWAPAHDETDEEHFEAIMQELREQQPNTHPDVLNVLARAQLDTDRDYRQRNGQPPAQPHEPSLRSAAILQSVRRHRIGQAAAYSRQRELMHRYNTARSALVRQYAADAQESIASGENLSDNPAREERLQRVDDLLTLSDTAMRMDVHAPRDGEPQPDPTSVLRNLRLHHESREARDAATPEPFVYAANMQRLHNGQEARQPADALPTQHAAETLEDLRRLYLSNPRAHATSLGLTANEVHMLAFKKAIELISKVQDADEDDVSNMMQIPELVTGLYAHGLKKPLLEFRNLHKTGSAIAPTSFLQAGTQFIGSQSSSQLPPAWNSTSGRPANAAATAQTIETLAGQPSPGRLPGQSVPANRFWLREADEGSSAPNRFSTSPNSMSRVPSAGHTSVKQPVRWTVKVSVHNVDYEAMTLQGTMEAFDVPSMTQMLSSSRPNPSASVLPANSSDPSSPANAYPTLDPNQHPTSSASAGRSTFSTFVEGQIIDFSRHSLLTPGSTFSPGLSASGDKPSIAPDKISYYDALYWRKLEPFASLPDARLASALFDPQWIKEELLNKYVLMRWKERCFVNPTTSSTTTLRCPPTVSASVAAASPSTLATTVNGYGLSISGFYYISLRRSDGRCMGLYYDPQNSPYEHLEMRVAMAGSSAVPKTCVSSPPPAADGTTQHASPGEAASASEGSGSADTEDRMRAGGLWAVGSWQFR